MQEVRPPRRERWPQKAAGDKGYSYPRVRRWLARRGVDAVIPQRSDQAMRDGDLGLDRRAHQRRSAVERCVGRLKECRRVGTRFDQLAGSFRAFVRLAFIQRYLRLLDPSDKTYSVPEFLDDRRVGVLHEVDRSGTIALTVVDVPTPPTALARAAPPLPTRPRDR